MKFIYVYKTIIAESLCSLICYSRTRMFSNCGDVRIHSIRPAKYMTFATNLRLSLLRAQEHAQAPQPKYVRAVMFDNKS